MKTKEQPFIMVIFGASGDLTKRKLMPALYSLYKRHRLTENFTILGVARTAYGDVQFRSYIHNQLNKFLDPKEYQAEEVGEFCKHLYYVAMDPSEADDYLLLANRLQELSGSAQPNNILYYLSTPPSLYGVVPVHLKAYKLNSRGSRIIVEKPFGYDLESALKLNNIYASVFDEKQVYRIDHFLGKETAQNILAFRFANGIFEPLWNRNYIDYVEITATENIGIEQRGGYYDESGALRDMVQNHLIQLLALTAMEPPVNFNATEFRNEVIKVYNSLVPLTETDFKEHVIRGQYTASDAKKGYREEQNVKPDSRTDTYIAMRLNIGNWRWAGVPFYIRTGKQLPTKVTEIVVHFKETPHHMFHQVGEGSAQNNTLILRIQPNEGVQLRVAMKVPGSGFEIKQTAMDFTYDKLGGLPPGDAYARLIEDCIASDPTLFTRNDAIEASWRFFDPLISYWKQHPDAPLYGYPAGTWGPKESEAMMNEHGATWTNPCKNLTDSDQYCEL
ncbi:glucose-6-phosphate dehydrogenase [Bacteroides sp. 214]|uniref:glucose-6-phosphate dehydrogenase n=1 Tax=Bacteroides sp. 214 TaxID=2302935 RepID=UPI0013D27E4E|nr:glucose-6-phosphate dehydrogenase [Bacteroides sp. 214]NDW11345.1 glucose-6-phosphate dehydrogenase [Bacteroides sp. 214]